MNNDSNDRSTEDLLSDLSGGERTELQRTWDLAAEADDARRDVKHVKSAYRSARLRMGGGPRSKSLVLRGTGLAAALVAGIILGWAAFGGSGSTGGSTETNDGGRYLILIRNDADPAVAPDDARAVREFREWAGELAVDGRLIDAAELLDAGFTLAAIDSDIRAEELPMIDERATGYFMIRASSRREAEAIGRQCPHLRYGGSIEIREIKTS